MKRIYAIYEFDSYAGYVWAHSVKEAIKEWMRQNNYDEGENIDIKAYED